MGVRGLTTFIANRSDKYMSSYELHNSYLVLDGNSVASQLYKWHCKCNDCFGGDYDKYINVVNNFFKLLSDCDVIPLLVFDGAYEKRKRKTVLDRMKNKIAASKALNSLTEGQVSLFPLFLREIFVDIVLKLGIKSVRCDFEGDSDAAYLAKTLNCPLLSYDSDFYIFDVLYIPFSTMELKLKKKKNINYISCKVYRVDKFLNSFGGLNKINLPILAVMLGNDYIKKRAFARFYQHLKIYKSKENEQQKLIKSLIIWLQNETPETAIKKVLARFKLCNRKRLSYKIKKAIEGYYSTNTYIFEYFNIDLSNKEENIINLPSQEEIEAIPEDECSDNEEEEEEETSGEKDSSDDEAENNESEHEKTKFYTKFNIPTFFIENFRKCAYPPCFMDMKVSNTYYCIPQIEDCDSEHSHTISLGILTAIHKILTFPETKQLIYIARIGHSHIKKFYLPIYKEPLPQLTEIENMDLNECRRFFFEILNIKDDKILDLFPSSWHLFLISIKYWVINSKTSIELPLIYSLVLCAIILNYVDNKVGFYRSTKSFLAKYGADNITSSDSDILEKNIKSAVEAIDLNNSIACLKKLIYYFQMDVKMKSNTKLFDRSLIHQFAQFQSCLLHIKYLNSLLNCPISNFIISNFYDGTFLYNMTTNLIKRTNLNSYMQILLDNCPRILKSFELMIGKIEEYVGANVNQHDPPKKRRKRRKKKTTVIEDTVQDVSSDEEYVLDSNNIYSLLSVINK